MTHAASNEERQEAAALYALGALTQHEARRFEKHMQGCRGCRTDIESFEFVVDNLGFGAAEAKPPEDMRNRLMNRISMERSLPTASYSEGLSARQRSVLTSDGEWWPVQEGILVKLLHLDQSTGIQTSLVRLAAGTRLPAHRHKGLEQFFVLEGDCSVNGESLGAGDYHRAEAGSIHLETYTEHGTLLLLIAPESYEVLEAQ